MNPNTPTSQLTTEFMISAYEVAKDAKAKSEFLYALSNAVDKHPEIVDAALVGFISKIAGSEKEKDRWYVTSAIAGKIAEKRPELVDDAMITGVVTVAIASGAFDTMSRDMAHKTIGIMLDKRPELGETVLNTARAVVATPGKYYFDHDLPIIGIIAEKRADLAETLLKEAMAKAVNGDDYRRQEGQKDINVIIKKCPQLAEKALSTLAIGAADSSGIGGTCHAAQDTLSFIVEKRPDMVESVLVIERLLAEKKDEYVLGAIHKPLRKIVEQRPDLAEEVLAIATTDLMQAGDSGYGAQWTSYAGTRETIGTIIEKRHDLVEKVLDFVESGIDKGGWSARSTTQTNLRKIVEVRPDKAEEVLKIVEKSAVERDSRVYEMIPSTLGLIAEKRRDMVDSRFVSFAGNMAKKCYYGPGFETLSTIVKSQPKFASKVLSIVKDVVMTETENHNKRRDTAVLALGAVVEAHPGMGPLVLGIAKTALRTYSQCAALTVVGTIAEKRPDLIDANLAASCEAIAVGGRGDYTRKTAQQVVDKIAARCPDVVRPNQAIKSATDALAQLAAG